MTERRNRDGATRPAPQRTVYKNVDVIVLGAGIVGVSAAVQLQRRGRSVVLVDRAPPGLETSFGNAGLIQSEAVLPYLFPRQAGEFLKHALGLTTASSYHLRSLPRLAGVFHSYWKNSKADRALEIARARAPLIERSVADHLDLARLAGIEDLYHATGWTQVFQSPGELDGAIAERDLVAREFGVAGEVFDAAALKVHEPALRSGLTGGVHWPTAIAVKDPLRLTRAYVALFEELGGVVAIGDAGSLEPSGRAWLVALPNGNIRARDVVVALGPWSADLARRFGYSPPTFVKRGYHLHFAVEEGPKLTRAILDAEGGYVLAPMDAGVRLTTGAEFADRDARKTPVQLKRTEPLARRLLPSLGARLDGAPWMGCRPCTPDMLPILGRMPGQMGLWCAFGHAHQGLTMGPTTGLLLAQMMLGEDPFTDPAPYRADRSFV